MAGEQRSADARVRFVAEWAGRLLKLKPEKANKFVGSDSVKPALHDFLDKVDFDSLVLCSSSGGLTADTKFPSSFKGKVIYFVKKWPGAVSKTENLRERLVFGDLPSSVLDFVAAFVEQVLVPVVCRDSNRVEWPTAVAADVGRQVRELRLLVEQTWSEVRGAPSLATAGQELSPLRYLENTVAWWDRLVDDLLASELNPAEQCECPGPVAELDFWKSRFQDLSRLHEQLGTEATGRVGSILEATASTYSPVLSRLKNRVKEALTEAEDLNRYLGGLRPQLDALSAAEFHEVSITVWPTMHLVCIAWARCQHFQRLPRLVRFLQRLASQLVEQAKVYIDSSSIFHLEIPEALEKLAKARALFRSFDATFLHFKGRVASYFQSPSDVQLWDLNPRFVFGDSELFVRRIGTVQELLETAGEFSKLDRVDVGNGDGRLLSARVATIHHEFMVAYGTFQGRTVDVLDPANKDLDTEYGLFRRKVTDWERRLGAVVRLAFEDCVTAEAVFKLLSAFGTLLRRPTIRKECERQYPRLVHLLRQQMVDAAQEYERFVECRQRAPTGVVYLARHSPPVSATLTWVQAMRERISAPVASFRQIEHPIVSSDAAKQVFNKYRDLMNKLERIEGRVCVEWRTSVEDTCRRGLEKAPLLRQPSGGGLTLNLDPRLLVALQEAASLRLMERDDALPESVRSLLDRGHVLRHRAFMLRMVAERYNAVRRQDPLTLRVVKDQLLELDQKLDSFVEGCRWKDLDDFEESLKTVSVSVADMEARMAKANVNVRALQESLVPYKTVALFERPPAKLMDLDDVEERVRKRCADLNKANNTIIGLVQENGKLLQAEVDSDGWVEYAHHLDCMVTDGLTDIVSRSLIYLLDNTDRELVAAPLLSVTVCLTDNRIAFQPSLDSDSINGLRSVFAGLLEAAFHTTDSVHRIAPDHPPFQTLRARPDLGDMKCELMTRVDKASLEAVQYVRRLAHYEHLWLVDRDLYLQNFVQEASIRCNGSDSRELSLDRFREQVDRYEAVERELQGVTELAVIHGWLRVHVKPIKTKLLEVAAAWICMFKDFLMDNLVTSLKELDDFVRVTEDGMKSAPKDGDYDSLVALMRNLQAVRDRQATTDAMFEPLKKTADFLRAYNRQVPDDVHFQLQELPEKWSGVKKLAVIQKQQAAALQAVQVARIRSKCSHFETHQQKYREEFKSRDFYDPSCANPYESLDQAHSKLTGMEAEMEELRDSAQLFEVSAPDFQRLRQCRRDVKLLKHLWDHVMIVRGCFCEWQKTPWMEIDIEQMDLECKKFAKDIRALDKEMRPWPVYVELENMVKNLLTALRAVGELQNQAIRDRHWQQLMEATGVTFVMDERTTLADLLSLQLHNYEDEVRAIVDKAVKEMSMEKVMRDLDATWTTMELEYERHARTGVQLVRASEDLIAVLEDNQVQLQSIATSKYISYFLQQVSAWQTRLKTAEKCITVWLEVQRTWLHLESIFVASEDIRQQLPEDTRRFDELDANFRALLTKVTQSRNVLEATGHEGMHNELQDIRKNLTLCEKALAEYLEIKRLAFPRFYFLSSADLLDILSNGRNPQAVMRHMTKLFDSLAKLEFVGDAEAALGMYARDGEYVPFAEACDLSGQVEVWLGRVLRTMRLTVRTSLSEAVAAYEDKPRERWLFDYPAQVSLCATQVWWTAEVNAAFCRLEEGYDNALKDYYKKQIQQLNTLITMLLGELSTGDRQKIMTICTVDVHARDVVGKMIAAKVDSSQAFVWQSQLRHRWDETHNDCFANVCDAQLRYLHEYLGNTPRLVITPLTDRCYITLTQSLHLIMGGAPTGPAGTGKTETTKDLGRALGIMVYVFNCSEQMDYKSCGTIYKGLAQTGAWGCFDEFNRISVEVLSVVAVQVKSIQEAIREKRLTFDFLGEDIPLDPCVGLFITMNPGYAGRSELPENLKALFRPCAMVVPDFELICEIMLVAEGFLDARKLARKFITLYTLCKELLSKQDHYDWGLRAIKSVLVVAGALKRADPGRPEDQVLMRALRDFNVPKIVAEDIPIFMGLIGDLFPSLEVPRKRNQSFEGSVRQACSDLALQPEDGFILKVVQLQELLDVRHSVFIIGNAGTGKTRVWNTLFRTYQNLGMKPVVHDLDPKAVTNDELFGVINRATREWKDGLLSSTMRELANGKGDGPRWVVMDGDIDPMWIESLNTVMDDNKVLTLASNERIALTSTMRLLFEITTLKCATPATVSRAGILYINSQDLGWNPYVASWIATRESVIERSNLAILFDKYVPTCLETMRTRFKKITPITDMSHVQMLCHLVESLLAEDHVNAADTSKDVYEMYFVFACVWAFGAATYHDQLVDYRAEFSKWWQQEFKSVKFAGSVFDYFIDPQKREFVPWTERVASFERDPDKPLQATVVPTSETVRLQFFLTFLLEHQRPVMLVGGAGCGKTVLVNQLLAGLSDEKYVVTKVPFNFYTTSEMLQRVLEKPLEKKAGRVYGPPGTRRLVYFVDDMNMPEVDKYDTVQPHTIVRQHLDYNHWYDRHKLTLKEIRNCQYLSCLNPTAGSFTISPRLQRHFCVLAVSFPSQNALHTIYNSILEEHLTNPANKFATSLQDVCSIVTNTALKLHQKVAQCFLPSALKFHYVFNLRDISNLFQGLLFSSAECVRSPADLVRLLVHEGRRVYQDKLIDDKDMDTFAKILNDVVKKNFEELDDTFLHEKPLVYCHFAKGIGEPKYMPMNNWEQLSRLLQGAMDSYNEINAAMNLVLFENAMEHICRINRILESPQSSALLVGVGGSGKQSLARLAAFISGLEVAQITIKKGYGITDFITDLATLHVKAGVKNVAIMFLMTDAQVMDERFLVLINDLLASGEIADLFPDDEVDNIVTSLRSEVRAAGNVDTKENCWKFFMDRVRRQLKVVLCFSPVGSTLRVRSRKFPAIINCTCMDWFHEWPQEALVSVSMKFLREIDILPAALHAPMSQAMAHAHVAVTKLSKMYLLAERRYNYTTPKSFLEQINLYRNLLHRKFAQLHSQIERLENGLRKLHDTSAQVDALKEILAGQEVILKQKNEDADKLIRVVAQETETVSAEKALAAAEAERVAQINVEVSQKQRECEDDLTKAEPALFAAQEALDTLNKNNLTELKSFGSPPPAVSNVTAAVMVLTSGGKIPRDRSWKAAKIMMAKVDQFLDDLVKFDKENVHPEVLKAIRPYLDNPEFQPDLVRSKSAAAAGLCSWVINIIRFYEVFCDVEPKRLALKAANAELAAAQENLATIATKIENLEAALATLTEAFQAASADKQRCQEEAEKTYATIALANRLVGGLASENVRWAQAVADYRQQEHTLPGDVFLISAFISYAGGFGKLYRTELMEKKWLPFLRSQECPIPLTDGLDPLTLLTDDAQVAVWNNEGLPNDRVSTENATILTFSERWPLIIDPQLQGIKWIKKKYRDTLQIVQLGQKGYQDIIEKAVQQGRIVLLENIGESIDPVLDPLLGRNLIRKGTAIKIGDKEVEYNANFKLILHTKLANPHYKPELQAQTTLINFTVTRDGLEDQLLAEVVNKERPELEMLKADLTKQQNDYKIALKELEDSLLQRLSSAQGDFLGDAMLVDNLENTKRTALETARKVNEAKKTEAQLNTARNLYRPAAARASLLYFILGELANINPLYVFSLKAFKVVFNKAIERAEPNDDVAVRVNSLIDCITFSVFLYTSRGLFERDKLTFTLQMTLQILVSTEDVNHSEVDFLLRYPAQPNVATTVDFLTDHCWGGIKTLSSLDEFRNLDRDIEANSKRWKKFLEAECPEKEKMPGEWKNRSSLQRLCILRALRPDRMTCAVSEFVAEKLGCKYTKGQVLDFATSFEESGPATPIFFILSPGVDPLQEVEALGRQLGYTWEKRNMHNVSLGQGQETVAEAALETAIVHGHWVILQNIHLVRTWLPKLEEVLESAQERSHRNLRVLMSAEPPSSADSNVIPPGLLESAIKITNEPPAGIKANLHKALDNFTQEWLEMCTKEAEFKSVLFSMCYFHAVITQRRKFGAQGWNTVYPFSTGDLTISAHVLLNYLETGSRVPWEDLRYLFGEIMYGGHITDHFDRRLCRAYLEEYMRPEQLEGELLLAPDFPAPPSMDYSGYHQYVEDALPPESPYLYGLHPNAEIGFLTARADSLFRTVLELQPRLAAGSGGVTVTRDEKVKQVLDEMWEKLPDEFNVVDMGARVEEKTPYIVVALQECERMNVLLREMRRALRELDLGLKGELTITADMEVLSSAMYLDQVPASWTQLAYPSLLTLGAWYADLLLRYKELESWTTDFQLPAVVWLSGFFNPQSFLTAIMQLTARRNEMPLDKMCLQVEVTKKTREEISASPREGAYVHGLYLEGARWDTQSGVMVEPRIGELHSAMPVLFIRAIHVDKQESRSVYECPVYKTRTRGNTYIWTFNLKTKERPTKWILAGVALLLQI